MLIPIPDVPRWYAERRPKDVIAISHGGETPTETTACASVQGGKSSCPCSIAEAGERRLAERRSCFLFGEYQP